MDKKAPFTVFKQKGSHQFYHRWDPKEDLLLSKAVARYGLHKWTRIASCIPGRSAVQCSTRWFGALNINIHKGKWSKKEDDILIESVQSHQRMTKTGGSTIPWNRIAEKIQSRTGVQCQARWTEALDPKIRKGRWTDEENKLLETAIAQYGCCWIRVSSLIPTRTQRQCRTRWNQIKRLKNMHNDMDTTSETRDKEVENDAYLFEDNHMSDRIWNFSQIPDMSYDDLLFEKPLLLSNPSAASSPATLEHTSPFIVHRQDTCTFNDMYMQQAHDPMFIYPFTMASIDICNYFMTN